MQPAETVWVDQRLGELAAAVEYPATPDLANAISRRLTRRSGEGHRRWRLAVAGAAAVSLLAAGSAVLLAPESREAVAEFLGLGVKGERIEILPPTATPVPGATATPTPPPIDAVATRTTLEAAPAQVGFEPVVPAGADVTDVFLLEFLGLPGVVLRTPEYDLWQFTNDDVFIGKGVPGLAGVHQTRVEGGPAYWVTGGPRVLTGRDAAGNEITGLEVSTNVNALVWAEGSITFRLEGDFDLEAAIEIAEGIQ